MERHFLFWPLHLQLSCAEIPYCRATPPSPAPAKFPLYVRFILDEGLLGCAFEQLVVEHQQFGMGFGGDCAKLSG